MFEIKALLEINGKMCNKRGWKAYLESKGSVWENSDKTITGKGNLSVNFLRRAVELAKLWENENKIHANNKIKTRQNKKSESGAFNVEEKKIEIISKGLRGREGVREKT